AQRTGRGPAGRVGHPLPVRLVAGRPVVRARVRAGVRAALPDRPRVARGGRTPLGMVLGPHDRVRPVRADGRVPPDRGARGAALERGIEGDDAAVRRRGRGVGRGGAGGRGSAASRSMMRRFVDGARAWVEAMPAAPLEYAMLGVAPELPQDLDGWAAAFAYLAWGLSGNWDDALLRLRLSERFGPETAAALLPPPAVDPPGLAAGSLAGRLLGGLPRSRGEGANRWGGSGSGGGGVWAGRARSRGQGSNSWVVSGSRTASGRPLLANDPHLLVQQPAAWFELHLRAPGYEARGIALPFVPGILAGTTPHHAWGLTNVSGDIQDLYVERLNDEGTAAEFDDAWEPLVVHAETIEVRGGAAVTFDVLETRHGPILETAPVGVAPNEFARRHGTYAL